LTGDAVQVIGVPAQTGFWDGAMLTEATVTGVTDTVELALTLAGEAQAAVLVITQLTTSLLLKVDVNEELLLPAFVPFTIHW
jgi:hypothetical protein